MPEAGDVRLVEFSFSSHLVEGAGSEAMLQVLRQAWSNNRRAGITGRLRIAGSRVEQTVEGPSAAILALSARILTDRLHGNISIRRFGPICARRYHDWRVEGLACPAPAPGSSLDGLRLVVPETAVAAPPAAGAPCPVARRAT